MRKPLLLVPVLLLAGCRSEQVALKLQPTAITPVVAAAPPAFLADTTLVAAVTAARPAVPLVAEAAPLPQPQRGLPSSSKGVKPVLPLLSRALIAKPIAKQLAQHLRRRPTTEGAAESGLGHIALFFIGVVLAVLAGLAALVNVIFSVGFFTALGYVAAGLVVIALLYLLFSGGKKKK